jgi:hypothetical protein
MVKNLSRLAFAALAAAAFLSTPPASAAALTFTQLAGVTGGTLQGTSVYRADLGSVGLAALQSIAIQDNSGGLGGAGGAFSGFDLDAIKLSTTLCATSACAQGLVGLAVFDFTSAASTIFTPGTQRPPTDPNLFGTDASGTQVDNAIATLGAFDGESTTVTPAGFLSLGDNGAIAFNLLASVSTAGLYLYIGEVGNNGELAAGTVTVSDNRIALPSTLALASLGLVGLGLRRRGGSGGAAA